MSVKKVYKIWRNLKFALFYFYILGTEPEIGKIETGTKLNHFAEYLAVLIFYDF